MKCQYVQGNLNNLFISQISENLIKILISVLWHLFFQTRQFQDELKRKFYNLLGPPTED
jgi:hypothetical protein